MIIRNNKQHSNQQEQALKYQEEAINLLKEKPLVGLSFTSILIQVIKRKSFSSTDFFERFPIQL